MAFSIVRNDITKMKVDAIVNTANPNVGYGSGTDTAVYMAAGKEKLLEARTKIGVLEEGEAAITPGFNLPAKYVIHAVSPAWWDGNQGESEKLINCYRNSLRIAKENGVKSLAFPLIASGSFQFPKEEALQIALNEINAFLLKEEMEIILVIFDDETYSITGKLFSDIDSFIDSRYVDEKQDEEYSPIEKDYLFSRSIEALSIDIEADFEEGPKEEGDYLSSYKLSEDIMMSPRVGAAVFEAAEAPRSLDDIMKHSAETFQEMLFRLIDEKELNEVEVYKAAQIDKKHFSKIRSNRDYNPKKQTVFALALAMHLSLDETRDLLARAGYAFSPSSKQDLAVEYFIEKEEYNIITINMVLFERKIPLL